MRRLLGTAVAVLWAVAFAGCEQSTSGAHREAVLPSPEEDRPAPGCPECQGLAEALVELAQVECAVFLSCGAPLIEWLYGDSAGCAERAFDFRLWQATLPGTRPSADALRACSAALSGLSCDEFFAGATVVSECSFVGGLALGQPCLDGAQCQSGFCPSVDRSCATCAEPPGENAPCTSPEECAPGLGCSAQGSCVRLANAGESCGSARPCDEYLACRGVCVALPNTPGASCTPAEGCDARSGVVCHPESQRCVEYVPGAACAWAADQLFLCANSGQCTTEGCMPAAEPGEACDLEVGPVCRWPDRCVEGRCVALPEASICD